MLATEKSSPYTSLPPPNAPKVSHLRLLEAESIHILREVASEFERPVMLYSIGKDSSVMLRLAEGVLSGADSLPAAAHRYRLQVRGDACVSRCDGALGRRRAAGVAE